MSKVETTHYRIIRDDYRSERTAEIKERYYIQYWDGSVKLFSKEPDWKYLSYKEYYPSGSIVTKVMYESEQEAQDHIKRLKKPLVKNKVIELYA